jgi:hypothetical protein
MKQANQRKFAAGAFTLTELVVIIAVVGVLSAVALPWLFRSNEQVLRVRCLSNLREVGIGLNVYSAEASDYFPVCGWPQGQNPWQTYSAARVMPGTGDLTRGFMSLGLLFRTGIVRDAKAFYCPGLARNASGYAYDYYATVSNGWPSTPVGSGDEQIRTGYNYYPQLRATVLAAGYSLPKLTYASTPLEVGGTFSLVTPAKWPELNLEKSVTTDLVQNLSVVSHRTAGSIAGLNALFPDGRAVFQNPRGNAPAFDPALWGTADTIDYVGNNPLNFRVVMNLWKP